MKSNKKLNSGGTLVAIIIIIIILVIGGIYFANKVNFFKTPDAIIEQVEKISAETTQIIDEGLTSLNEELNIDNELQSLEDDLGDLDSINLDTQDLEL